MLSSKPRKWYNIYIALGFIIGGLIDNIIVLVSGITHWSLWIILSIGILVIILGAIILYKNKEVFGLKTLGKYGNTTTELHNATEKKMYNYLKTNVGTAYTAKALLKRVEKSIKHPNFKNYVMKNGEIILDKMVTEGKVQTSRKNDEIHCFFQAES